MRWCLVLVLHLALLNQSLPCCAYFLTLVNLVYSLSTPVCLKAACWFFPVGQCGSLADACLVDSGQLLRQRGSFSHVSSATAWWFGVFFKTSSSIFHFSVFFSIFAFISHAAVPSNRKGREGPVVRLDSKLGHCFLDGRYLSPLSHQDTLAFSTLESLFGVI